MTDKDRRTISALVGYIPKLEDAPKKHWSWETELKDGNPPTLVIHKPQYFKALSDFMEVVSQSFQQRGYDSIQVQGWLEDPMFLDRANFTQMRSVFTWICRGERFCDGHWIEQLKTGNLVRALIRLRELSAG